jgi:hypothetical protein
MSKELLAWIIGWLKFLYLLGENLLRQTRLHASVLAELNLL